MENETTTDSELLIGTIDEFHTQTCYNLYMYAVGLAQKVNEYIDSGFLVLHNNQPMNKFVFYGMMGPCVAEEDGNCMIVWFGSGHDDDGKVWLHGDYNKKTILEQFREIKIIDPKHLVSIF